MPGEGRPGNIAAAIAVALELGVDTGDVAARLGTLPGAPHRLERSAGSGGVVVLDDTYNANPAGVRAALAVLGRSAGAAARRVVVTPGMVELGPVRPPRTPPSPGKPPRWSPTWWWWAGPTAAPWCAGPGAASPAAPRRM